MREKCPQKLFLEFIIVVQIKTKFFILLPESYRVLKNGCIIYEYVLVFNARNKPADFISSASTNPNYK